MRAVSNSPGACMFLCGLGWLLFHYADFGKATAAIEDFKQKYNLILNGIMYAPDTRELPDAFHMLPVLLILSVVFQNRRLSGKKKESVQRRSVPV